MFAPQQPPADYRERAAVELVLRPTELIANAEDLNGLKAFVTAQAPNYGEIQAPTVVITGDATRPYRREFMPRRSPRCCRAAS